MTIVTKNSITVSNVNDGTITHTAYAYSIDGTDRFTTVYPNLNLLDGTKDFSGTWTNSSSWVTDGTYKGLTVKKRTAQWNGIYKTFTAPKDGVYTFSAYIKSSGNAANVYRYGGVNTTSSQPIIQKQIGNNFDWTRDNVTLNLKANDSVWIRYEISGAGTDSILWVAGYKYESSSIATPPMPSSTEVTNADWPSYIGQYSDFSSTASTDPAKYAPWTIFKGNDGKDGLAGKDGNGIKTTDITYAISTSGTTAPTTGWTSSVPSPVNGQYLWTKTVWTYTDNSSKTGYSVTYISKDGNNGNDGDPGKIVSDTEPTTRFKGLTWKYSGTADLTASDGTVIKPNIEYYYNGTKWLINLIEANQLNVNELAAISAYLGHVYAAIVEDNQSDGSGFLLDSEKQLLRVNKTANTYNQIFSEGLTTFAKISDLPGIGNIIPGANYISAILAGNFLQFGQYSTAVDSDGVPVGGVSVGEGSISFGQTTSGSYGFTLTGDLTVAGNIKSLKDTDWIDIPPASGWGGTMRYMIAEGKFYLRLTNVTNPAVSAATAKTMCTIPTTAVPLGGIRGIPIMSYGQPIAELVINANGTIQFYSHDAVGTGQSLHVFVQGIPLT